MAVPQIVCTLVSSWEQKLAGATTVILPGVPRAGEVLVIDKEASGASPVVYEVVAVGYRSKEDGSPGKPIYEPRVLLKVEPYKAAQ